METEPESEAEPFLPQTGTQRLRSSASCSTWSRLRASATTLRSMILIHLFLLAIYTTVSIAIIRGQSTSTQHGPPNGTLHTVLIGWLLGVQSDDNLAIENLEIHRDTRSHDVHASSKFSGPPDTVVDVAWAELLGSMNIRVSDAELARNGRSSVEFPDNGGFLAWLGVFHELHCIVRSEMSSSRWKLPVTREKGRC